MTYPHVEPSPNLPKLEERVLARWSDDHTFEASVAARPAGIGPGATSDNEYVFYDGPPFANGLPHYGHLLTGFVKDAVPRYQTMRGRRVERRFGWDCHGLPAEVEAERQLGITARNEIVEMGVAAFNAACKESVLRYTSEWERYVNRQARWVDFENDYKTLDLPYMESVMWAFKTLWDKGLVYEGYRVLPYCWRCETPLSNTETRMDDVYRDRQDPALTVWFQLLDGDTDGVPGDPSLPVRMLAWTTTPWTLPSNLALAVGPGIDYAVVEHDGARYVLAAARLGSYGRELDMGEYGRELGVGELGVGELDGAVGAGNVKGTVAGSALVGRRYAPLFPYFADAPNAFRVVSAEFVSTEDGTGVVHLSPGHGEDDQTVCNANGIDTIVPMDGHGAYTSEITDWPGIHVFDANPLVIRRLKDLGRVLRHESYDHSYPHCWRCANPLVYRAISSWFVKVTAFRDRMVELNQEIRWVPEHIRDGQFGKWLANARDWSISRNRFWGSPIPVWRSDDPRYPRLDVYGSVEELHRDFGVHVTDLHRPMVDDLVRPNPDDPSGQSMMRRVPEVLDCWFESGSMPFAQAHYPFENRDWFEDHYPGDFIVEYIGQTRGWFYTLHVLATALFDRPAFSTCVAHGIVLGNDGLKMSKSLRNYPDPYEMYDTYGADAMRWFLLSSAILRGSDLVVTEQGIRDAVRQVILPLWNAWYFFTLYAGADGDARAAGDASAAGERGGAAYAARRRTDQTGALDRYLLAKVHDLVATMTTQMDDYDLFGACASVRSFLETLTNWYIRRSRDRFWAGTEAGGQDTVDAFDTLYTALEAVTRLAAPLLPMITEEIFTALTGEPSVHLADWPSLDDYPADPSLVTAMDGVRDVCSAASAVRKARGLRNRLPLNELQVTARGASALKPFEEIIMDEVNVKKVTFPENVNAGAKYELKLIPAALGPRLGNDMQRVMAAFRKGGYTHDPTDHGRPVIGGIELVDGEYELRLVPTDPAASAVLASGDGVVTLDTVVTPELEAEGLARDVVRQVQQARRDAGLQVSDRVRVAIDAPARIVAAVRTHETFVRDETLAVAIELTESDQPAAPTGDLDGAPVTVTVARTARPSG